MFSENFTLTNRLYDYYIKIQSVGFHLYRLATVMQLDFLLHRSLLFIATNYYKFLKAPLEPPVNKLIKKFKQALCLVFYFP